MKKNMPNLKANKSILFLTYVMAVLFLGMIGYFGYFLQFQSEGVINNPYNARLDRFADRILRGEIVSSDGSVLAKTEVGADGSEVRTYPYNQMFAHVVGYSDHGKTGIESLANFYLLSSHVNLIERTVNEFSGRKSPGDRVVTTLDVGLQQAAWDALGDRKGAVIAMEPDTGKILAMISKPAFHPNTLAADWDGLIQAENKEAQLLNRATQGLYPPGSTFKLVTALEYIREHPGDWQNFTFDCDGVYEYGEYTISCYHKAVHGNQNLEQAFANSCNGAFASLGLTLQLERMRELTKQLLFQEELPLPLVYNKSSYALGDAASEWDILQTSIGQGNTQITPMHNALITAAVANGGMVMTPYLVDRVENVVGEETEKFMPTAYKTLLSAEESRQIGDLMRSVVVTGTGSALRTDAYTAAGKTGSAEFETGRESHAWFTGYAPYESPKLVVTVIVEEGGAGGQVAAPIARTMFDTYFSR